MLVAVTVFSMAGAASASEIKNNIDMAIQKQKEAHEIAEYVRGFGEAENHPAILFAQEKWWEQQKILTKLYKDYEQAISQEES